MRTTNIDPLTRPDPNHRVVWQPTRPELTIRHLRGTSTNRGYHEDWYEIISRFPLSADDLKHLDACRLLGSGQAYHLQSTETITDTVPPVTVDQRTGETVDVPPVNWYGTPIINSTTYDYCRYVVKRVCDSGD